MTASLFLWLTALAAPGTPWMDAGGRPAEDHTVYHDWMDAGGRPELPWAGDWNDAGARPAPETEFPLVLNPAVQRYLPRYERSAEVLLARNARNRWLVEDALADAGLPPELAAVAFVESGFANVLNHTPGLAPGAAGGGVWQFIPSSAHHWGLQVDGAVDERLDPELATEAAVAYLEALHERHGDWVLAIAAYNAGSGAVEAAIRAGGTHDAWELMRRGHLNDYAARVMAAAYVLGGS